MDSSVKDQITYALGFSDEERQRLIDQDEMFRSHTERLLRAAGLTEGMRVLDVGCGVGDVSIHAASLVGPKGTVLGVDRDARSLDLARHRASDLGLNNVSFAKGDVTSIAFNEPFDALVGRFILMYLPDPVATLRHLARLVSPGAVVAFQEYVMKHDGLSFPEPVTAWEEALALVVNTFELAGVDLEMGLKLAQVFTAAGLPAPHVHMDVHFLTPSDALGFKVAMHTVRSVLPLAAQFGLVNLDEIDLARGAKGLQAEFVAKDAIASWPPVVSAWVLV
jgi:SAM-dependent methyltransferase